MCKERPSVASNLRFAEDARDRMRAGAPDVMEGGKLQRPNARDGSKPMRSVRSGMPFRLTLREKGASRKARLRDESVIHPKRDC